MTEKSEDAVEKDEFYDKAVELVVKERKASSSFIQRKLEIGYNRAARIMEQMEKNGIVSPINEVGKRKVLKDTLEKQESEDLIEKEEKRVEDEKAAKPEIPNLVTDDEGRNVAGVAGKRLKSFIERVERLEEEKKGLMEDIKEVYAEGKATGFDVKTMRKIVRLRKMDVEKRREEDELLEVYRAAVGI